MVVWLSSHEVLIQLQDYLVVLLSPRDPDSSWSTTIDENKSTQRVDGYAERKSDCSFRLDALSDDLLFQELLESDCLTGKVSVTACCWKTGIDPVKLRSFVARHERIRLVTRVPIMGDDWGAV